MSTTRIAAHRGAAGGNIHCNTWVAFEAALAQGADIIELDVSRSADGELFVFHPGMEPAHLGIDTPLSRMEARDIRNLRYLNEDNTPTQLGISTLDEVFEQLKGRCQINLDKFPTCMADIARAVRRHGMTQQVLVKTEAREELFRQVEELAPDLPYMVFARREDTVSEMLRKRFPNYRGTEIIFPDETCGVAQPEYTERMHRLGLQVWVNAIVFDCRRVLAAGHNDDISVAGQPDQGWGWLMDLGADIIQTDWPGMLRAYMNRRETEGRKP